MNKTLADTDIYSEINKGKNPQVRQKAADYFDIHGKYTLSVVTVMEIVNGLHQVGREENIRTLHENLQDEEVLPFDTDTADIAGRILADLKRAGQTIGHGDVMIAATAIRHNLILTTGNTKHHQRIADLGYALTLDNWKTL